MEPLSELPERSSSLGKLREHGRSITGAGGRLAAGEAHFALRAGEARHRIHHEHDALAAVAEVFRDGRADVGGLQAHQRRFVGGGADDHGAFHALGAEVVLQKVPHLAAALADQRDHVDVGLGIARDHAQQRALPDARGGEQADTLAFAAGEQGVDGAHADGDRLEHALAAEGIGRVAVDRVFVVRTEAGRRRR